jgi:hypothetical protein
VIGRRDLLRLGAALLVPSCGNDVAVEPICHDIDEPLDEALAALHATDPEFDGGNSNHGPMAAEVLDRQGRGDRICGWTARYLPRLDALPVAQPLVDRAAALGDVTQRAAWIATYVAELETRPVPEVLAAAWPMLLPGFAAAAFHGPLRTGHALRSFAALPTAVRRTEIGHGLGYWAARYAELPGDPGSQPTAGLDVVQALDRLTVLPSSQQRAGGFVHVRMLQIIGFAPFVDEIARVDIDVWPVERTLTELVAAVTRLYIADGDRGDVGYLHAIDGTSILRTMLPAMDTATQRMALRYLFQAVAAVHATHASGTGVPPPASDPQLDPEDIAARGAAALDEHTIKLVEVAVREYAIESRPELLVAAQLRLGS